MITRLETFEGTSFFFFENKIYHSKFIWKFCGLEFIK